MNRYQELAAKLENGESFVVLRYDAEDGASADVYRPEDDRLEALLQLRESLRTGPWSGVQGIISLEEYRAREASADQSALREEEGVPF